MLHKTVLVVFVYVVFESIKQVILLFKKIKFLKRHFSRNKYFTRKQIHTDKLTYAQALGRENKSQNAHVTWIWNFPYHQPKLIITSFEAAESVWNSVLHSEKGGHFDRVINSIFNHIKPVATSKNKVWSQKRKFLNREFGSLKLDQYLDSFRVQSKNFVEEIKSEIRVDKTLKIRKFIEIFVMRTVTTSLFGVDLADSKLREIMTVFKGLQGFLTFRLQQLDFVY